VVVDGAAGIDEFPYGPACGRAAAVPRINASATKLKCMMGGILFWEVVMI